jgi:glycosyltransferase involved in cell wall biosynthesis
VKILIVNTRHYHGGGDSTYAFNLANLLNKNGHEIHFFGMQDVRNFPDPNEDLFVSNVDFKELNKKKSLKSGLFVLRRSIYSEEARQKFSKLLDRVNPDIIHAQNLHGHITPSVLFEAKKRDIPIVWTLHDYKLICPNTHCLIDTTGVICEACKNGKYFNAPIKRCKKGSTLASLMASIEAYSHKILQVNELVDSFICPSEFLKEKLLENGYSPKKVRQIPLVLKNDQFSKNEIEDGYFLFLGKIEKIKGIDVLLQSAKTLPDLKFKIAGRILDNHKNEFVSSLPKNVEYVGIKTGLDLQDLISRSLALVVPSIWYENQPYVILEAFAAGKPVIASDLGGMKELVSQGRGILVPPGDHISLAQGLSYLSDNLKIVKEMGDTAYQYAEKTFSEDIHYEQIMSIYKQFS